MMTFEPQYNSSRRVIQSTLSPALSGDPFTVKILCTLQAPYSQLILVDRVCIQSMDGLYLWQFGNVTSKMGLVTERPCSNFTRGYRWAAEMAGLFCFLINIFFCLFFLIYLCIGVCRVVEVGVLWLRAAVGWELLSCFMCRVFLGMRGTEGFLLAWSRSRGWSLEGQERKEKMFERTPSKSRPHEPNLLLSARVFNSVQL